jgi:Fe-S-cluster containining protein
VFPCTKCGACCVMAGRLGLMPQGKDGACVHLKNSECEIYDERPDVCRINVMQERSGIDMNAYHEITARICNALIDELGLDPDLAVTL